VIKMSWESLIKKSGMVYILFKSRGTDSGPPDYTLDEGYPVKAFSSYKILYEFLEKNRLMDLDPNNAPTYDTYKTKEFKERLAEEGLSLLTMPLDNMGAIKE
tara:strand:+ start:361 stop:666 length:306 start_codon:yes stop_codon:yes gene_type:complete